MVKSIMKFGATWCGPCRTLAKNIENDEELRNLVVNIDVDINEELASTYNITTVPVLVFTNENGEEIDRTVGALPISVIKSKIAELNGRK